MPSSRGSSQPRIEPRSPTFQADSLLTGPPGRPGVLERVTYPSSRGSSQPRSPAGCLLQVHGNLNFFLHSLCRNKISTLLETVQFFNYFVYVCLICPTQTGYTVLSGIPVQPHSILCNRTQPRPGTDPFCLLETLPGLLHPCPRLGRSRSCVPTDQCGHPWRTHIASLYSRRLFIICFPLDLGHLENRDLGFLLF